MTPEPAGGTQSAERRAQTEAHNRALVAAHAAAEREGRTLSPSQLNRLVKRYEREEREAAVSYVGHGPIVDRLPHRDRTANEALHNMLVAESRARGGVPNEKSSSVTTAPRSAEQQEFDQTLARFVEDPAERQAIWLMSSVSNDVFEQVLADCQREGNLSQANVARRCQEASHA